VKARPITPGESATWHAKSCLRCGRDVFRFTHCDDCRTLIECKRPKTATHEAKTRPWGSTAPRERKSP
jgi:hypothetical protein